jgi:AraC-like DNA-binding protein
MFKKITEANKGLLNNPPDNNMVYYSQLLQWYTTNAFRTFSVKYVIDECITYKVGKKEHHVKASNYLTACRHEQVEAYNQTPIRSICIDVCAATMQETFTVLTSAHDDFDNFLAAHFRHPSFYEAIHPVSSTSVGLKLQQLLQTVTVDGTPSLNKDWFIDLSERIIYQEYGNYLALQQIKSVKPSTKKEVLQRLQVAKEYIDTSFLEISEIKQVAEHCNMSEYHFYRRFKEVYKRTPYQYITELKMQLAKQQLQSKLYSVSEVAQMCSFPDVFTFSKAFKKFYGIPPSFVR